MTTTPLHCFLFSPAADTHNYARTFPAYDGNAETDCVSSDKSVYTDCSSMTYLVVGSPGCMEGVSTGLPPSSLVANSVLEYGYGQ